MTISEERKKRVIDVYYNQGKTTREIAKIERISIRDISPTLKEEDSKRQRLKDQQQQEEISSKAYKLFAEGKRPVEVAIALNLREPEATKLYREYWSLRGLDKLNTIYQETNGKIWSLGKLYKQLIKEKGMGIEKVANVVDIAANRLPHMETLYGQVKDQVDNMQRTIQRLENDIEARKNKISLLDKIAFSSELDCKRKEQEVQELSDKKNRIENLIANVLNSENDGYSKLKQIVKENAKAALSENKQVISVSFAALIQTLKTDPETVKLFYNIPRVNDGRQPEENNNSIPQYLESNKDSILDLVKKNYENLVEALTDNAIAAASSSNPKLSLRSSS